MFYVFAVLIAGSIGRSIGLRRGRATLGFVLGACFGVIGWVIVAALKPVERAATIAAPQPPVSAWPVCVTCNGPTRWYPEIRRFDCARCRSIRVA